MKMRYLKKVSSLRLDRSKCSGCRKCTEVCPHGVFMVKGSTAEITDIDSCMECGACAMNCEPGAIYVEHGVGCAAAFIYGFINRTEPRCSCGEAEKRGETCC